MRDMRSALIALVLCCLASVSTHAFALTQPLAGAVAWPNTTPLRLPFPAGNAVYVTSGYGPNMGSGLHSGLNNGSSGNDYYALDLVYANESNGGKGLPIVAALAGTVVKAGWATAGWANFGQRVLVQHDIGDGHSYITMYAHLDSIAVQEGESVTQGQTVGTLGESCDGDNMQLNCPSFGPHVHFAVHRNSTIGGSGTGGSYGGNAVVPEPLSGAEDLVQGMTITSDNAGTPCPSIPPEGAIIDDAQLACFTAGGNASYWRNETAGYDGSLRWTHGTDAMTVDNFGVWTFDFEQAGAYEVEIYTDAAFAQSQAAAYLLQHAGGSDVVAIDQSAADGWQSLGTFDFDAGGGQQLRLDDVTGEALNLERQLVFDAVRLTPANNGGAGGSAASGGAGGTGTTTSSSGNGGSGSGGAAASDEDGGCGCSTPGSRDQQSGSWLWLVAAAALASLRRRERGAQGSYT